MGWVYSEMVYKYSDIEFYPKKQCLRIGGGEAVKLPPMLATFLDVLFVKCGEHVPIGEIRKVLWPTATDRYTAEIDILRRIRDLVQRIKDLVNETTADRLVATKEHVKFLACGEFEARPPLESERLDEFTASYGPKVRSYAGRLTEAEIRNIVDDQVWSELDSVLESIQFEVFKMVWRQFDPAFLLEMKAEGLGARLGLYQMAKSYNLGDQILETVRETVREELRRARERRKRRRE